MSDPKPAEVKRPELKRRSGPLWRVYQGLYWSLVVGLALSISLSVTWHVLVTPDSQTAGAQLDVPTCTAKLYALYNELNEQGAALLSKPQPAEALNTQWREWSGQWQARAHELRLQCPTEAAPQLATLRDNVDRMHLAWSTAIKGFTEVGNGPLLMLKDPKRKQ